MIDNQFKILQYHFLALPWFFSQTISFSFYSGPPLLTTDQCSCGCSGGGGNHFTLSLLRDASKQKHKHGPLLLCRPFCLVTPHFFREKVCKLLLQNWVERPFFANCCVLTQSYDIKSNLSTAPWAQLSGEVSYISVSCVIGTPTLTNWLVSNLLFFFRS